MYNIHCDLAKTISEVWKWIYLIYGHIIHTLFPDGFILTAKFVDLVTSKVFNVK